MNNALFDELLASVEEMDATAQGHTPAAKVTEFPAPEVKAIRETMGLSQSRFAALMGVSQRTLENWEQGRRQPTGPAKTLLRLVAADPKHAIQALHG